MRALYLKTETGVFCSSRNTGMVLFSKRVGDDEGSGESVTGRGDHWLSFIMRWVGSTYKEPAGESINQPAEVPWSVLYLKEKCNMFVFPCKFETLKHMV